MFPAEAYTTTNTFTYTEDVDDNGDDERNDENSGSGSSTVSRSSSAMTRTMSTTTTTTNTYDYDFTTYSSTSQGEHRSQQRHHHHRHHRQQRRPHHQRVFVHHHRDSSLGFTFGGQPADVVCFRSCIPIHAARAAGAGRSGSGSSRRRRRSRGVSFGTGRYSLYGMTSGRRRHNGSGADADADGAGRRDDTDLAEGGRGGGAAGDEGGGGGRGGSEGLSPADDDDDGGELAPPPAQTGPFTADLFCIILLFIDVSSPRDIIEIGQCSRFWRYYANLAPHWTYFRRTALSKVNVDLPDHIRSVVAKPKVVTREEYIVERRKVEECRRRERWLNVARHCRWCLATAIMVGVMITANFVVAYFLGFLRTALRSDVNLSITTFVLMAVMTLLEVTVVIIPLGGVSSPSNKDGMIRILSWGLVMIAVSTVFGTITALAFTRVQAEGHVLDGPTLDLSMTAECTVYLSKSWPSFALLPAVLHDLRWRPLTMDPTETELLPYCLKESDDDKNTTQQCYVFLFFDATYNSTVFHNSTVWREKRDVGTRSAFGFDPIMAGRPTAGMWCAEASEPQVVALTTVMYNTVRAERDAAYPTEADWLDASRRPTSFGQISYRCSSDINREKTEDPAHSAELWFKYSTAWTKHYIPLLTYYQQIRSTFQTTHDHFLRYAYTCHIIVGALWGVQLLAQCILRHAAIGVLGMTTACTLLLLNPLTVILTGALCVHVNDSYFMCSAASGGSLIGGGVGMLFLLITVYVSACD